MKSGIKKFLVVLMLMVIVGPVVKAQEKDFSTAATLGLTTTLLDESIGIHVGLNPAVALSSRFAIEGQVSYIYTRINSSFLSGNQGNINSVNALVGARFYLVSREKSTRAFVNLLLGGNFNNESRFDYIENTFNFGFSVGVFLEIEKVLIGLSIDSPENLVLKAGYVF